ncbi:MAG: hypothetical protein LBW85_02525 [Deltaproteobacteria bacterium]|jgi:hypothetical protein|nr:hypothetical protein [Deltaproteobacteria bacterium]
MPLNRDCFPRLTPYDSADSGSGSLDFLGTGASAERLAEVIFPGFTARMWRPRLLTYSALASHVAARAAAESPEWRQDAFLESRLAFERIFVSAVIRGARKEGEGNNAAVNLPGSIMARNALDSCDARLGRNNFLKNQADNGSFGVMSKMARSLGITDAKGLLLEQGYRLLDSWKKGEGEEARDFNLDPPASGSKRSKPLDRLTKATSQLLQKNWPKPSWPGWQWLFDHFRLDCISRHEQRFIGDAFRRGDPVQSRAMDLMASPEAGEILEAGADMQPSQFDRMVCDRILAKGNGEETRREDGILARAVDLIDAHEDISVLLEKAFVDLRQYLAENDGQASHGKLKAFADSGADFSSISSRLGAPARKLRRLADGLEEFRAIRNRNDPAPLGELSDVAKQASLSPESLLISLETRHRKVQDAKGKAPAVHFTGDAWYLAPAYRDQSGLAGASLTDLVKGYLHNFRARNVCRFLWELGRMRGK